jgi:hypothetical protein
VRSVALDWIHGTRLRRSHRSSGNRSDRCDFPFLLLLSIASMAIVAEIFANAAIVAGVKSQISEGIYQWRVVGSRSRNRFSDDTAGADARRSRFSFRNAKGKAPPTRSVSERREASACAERLCQRAEVLFSPDFCTLSGQVFRSRAVQIADTSHTDGR